MQIEIISEEKIQDKQITKKTTAALLDRNSYGAGYGEGPTFYLKENDFGISHIQFNTGTCYIYTKPIFSSEAKQLLALLKQAALQKNNGSYPHQENRARALQLLEKINDSQLSELEDEEAGTLLSYGFDASYNDVVQKLLDMGVETYLKDEKPDPYKWNYFNKNNQLFSPELECKKASLTDIEERFIESLNREEEDDALALVKKMNNPNMVDEGNPVLALAASLGYLEVVKQLVIQGADLEATMIYKEGSVTALLEAAYRGRFAVIKYLVEQGANVNAQSNSGNTILHLIYQSYIRDLFTEEQFKELPKFLLDHGANPCIVNLNDQRPYDEGFSYMGEETMNKDAEKRIEFWSFDSQQASYKLKFPPISYMDKTWAWEAIVNKIKSTPVNGLLGLASDKTECHFANRGGQRADLIIPVRKDYVVKSIKIDEQLKDITIQIKDEYANNVDVHDMIVKCFAELNLSKDKPQTESRRVVDCQRQEASAPQLKLR